MPIGLRSGLGDLARIRRQGDASGAQGEDRRRRVQEKPFNVLFDLSLGQRLEIRENIRSGTSILVAPHMRGIQMRELPLYTDQRQRLDGRFARRPRPSIDCGQPLIC